MRLAGQPDRNAETDIAYGPILPSRSRDPEPDARYTIAFSVSFSTHVVNPAIYKLLYDVTNDFEPIALIADAASVVLSKKAIAANDLKE